MTSSRLSDGRNGGSSSGRLKVGWVVMVAVVVLVLLVVEVVVMQLSSSLSVAAVASGPTVLWHDLMWCGFRILTVCMSILV